MLHEATIAGDSFHLVLRVSGYEFARKGSGPDANWLNAEVVLAIKENWASSFSGSCSVSLQTVELIQFRDELAELLEHGNGEARLRHLEEQVGCTVRMREGKAQVDVFVRQHALAQLGATELPTDESRIRESLRQFDALVDAFPVKGRPS